MGESCREAKRCSPFSFFPLLLLPGPPPLGSRLSVKSPSTARPLGLVLALAPLVILNHGPRSAMPLRSGATPDITMTTLAGMETTVLTRWAPGTAAPEFATCPATGTPRSTVTWVWTATDAGWATTACPSSLVDVLPLQALAATMAAVLVVLEPASNLTLRSATALRFTVTPYDSDFCWYGNYCINQVNEWDGCHGVCSVNCNWETEDWCDMGTDLNGCWMGNWCQDKSMGGCPAPIGGSELNSGEDICAHMTYTEECSDSQISCDSGYSYEGCWLGNYCIDSVNSWDNCPGMCSTMCNWETENWCDMGIDANGCWMGNWCQDMSLGECPQVTMVSKRGAMEKMRALAAKAKAIGN